MSLEGDDGRSKWVGRRRTERMTGLNLILTESQYSRASMFTLRWSSPSWQMSALRKKTSAH